MGQVRPAKSTYEVFRGLGVQEMRFLETAVHHFLLEGIPKGATARYSSKRVLKWVLGCLVIVKCVFKWVLKVLLVPV